MRNHTEGHGVTIDKQADAAMTDALVAVVNSGTEQPESSNRNEAAGRLTDNDVLMVDADAALSSVSAEKFAAHTAADSRTPVSALTPVRTKRRAENLVETCRQTNKAKLQLEARNKRLEQDNIALRQHVNDIETVGGQAAFLADVEESNSRMAKEGFKRDTFQRWARGVASGELSVKSVEVHHFGDTARNYNVKSRGGFRFSRTTKSFCTYLLLLSRRCYRAIRGGEGLNLGRYKNKPLSSYNLISPHDTTLEHEMSKWDPDPKHWYLPANDILVLPPHSSCQQGSQTGSRAKGEAWF